MRIRLTQLAMDLDYTEQTLRDTVARRLGIPESAVLSCEVKRRSIDARRWRNRVGFVLVVEAVVATPADPSAQAMWQKTAGVELLPDFERNERLSAVLGSAPLSSLSHRPVVVGAGPAGLLAAWRLAQAGLCPILIERGAPVELRRESVGQFWAQGKLDPEDNVLFGEGGAGLFSDGKLTTRSKRREPLRRVMALLVQCGADPSILVDAEPHLGSDRLAEIVPQLRRRILGLGGEFRFHSRFEGLALDNGQLVGIIVNGHPVETAHCLLATGHSARDVYNILHRAGIELQTKAFAVGVRIEVPQHQIDASQYGSSCGHPRLGPASFFLTQRPTRHARGCYSFCMCPGGLVISCASSPGMLTSNGMSLSARSQGYGNAAFLVPVNPDDSLTLEENPLSSIAWQADLESKAFRAGGNNYALPASTLPDFLAGRTSVTLPPDRSCPHSAPADLHAILPDFVGQTLLHAVPHMIRKLRKVDLHRSVVYGLETRSSSPVRIVRDELLQSPSARGLYPIGEGAGYSGGIITSAIDGMRAAESLLVTLNPSNS